MAFKRTIQLDSGWRFRQVGDTNSKDRPTQGFPTEIHRDLLHHGLIPDPFVAKNEIDLQWVGEKMWTYEKSFVSPVRNDTQKVVLVMDGLDTYATVYLNGEKILQTQDMFIPERVDVTNKMLPDQNILTIEFESAWLKGKKTMEKYPEHLWRCWNGDPSRAGCSQSPVSLCIASPRCAILSKN